MRSRRVVAARAAIATALVLLGVSPALGVSGGDTITTISGGGNGDGFPAAIAAVEPEGVSVGPDGSIYVAEPEAHRVRRIDARSGLIETFAGRGGEGFAGDGGPATGALLRFPTHAVADGFGNVYICDQSNHRIRRVDSNGIISTVAGTGQTGSTDGQATSVARLYFPRSLGIDPDGNVLIAEPFNQRIRFLNVGAARVSTVAGTGVGGYSGDNGAATSARLQLPAGVWSLGRNTFLIADQANHRIRKVDTNGVIRTVAGNGVNGYGGDNGLATSAALSNPPSVSARADGSFVFVDQGNNRVRRVTATGVIQLVGGTGTAGYNGDGFAARQAQLNRPSGITYDAQGDCLVADRGNRRVRRIAGCIGSGTIETIAGIASSFTGDGWPALAAVLSGPADLVKDGIGNIFIADPGANRVRRIRPDGIIETYAGTGQAGFAGDGGPATSALLAQPQRVALDARGDLLILDTGNRRVRRVNAANRTISTIAGSGESGSTGDGGLAVNASFMFPLGLVADGAGHIYVADAPARRIRVIEPDGRIFAYAGTGVATGSIDGPGGNPLDNLGDFGPARIATFIAPADLALALGTLYVADITAHRVRQIDANGIIRPLTGTGTRTGGVDGEGGDPSDDLGDGGAATAASVNTPAGVDVTNAGEVLIADQANRRIRIVRSGVISTLGGNGFVTWSVDGEGGAARDDLGDGARVDNATFNALTSLFVDPLGNVLLTDSQARRVRLIESTTASISGRIAYYSNQLNVPDVIVDLMGPSNASVLTDSAGAYNSGSIPLGTWTVRPRKLGDRGIAVAALDAAHVLQHIAGLREFDADQRLACDVTANGTLSALDATRILQLTAGVLARFEAAVACDSDWVFIPTAGGSPPLFSDGSCDPGRITLALGAATSGQDFRALALGDCTGNWSP